MRHRARILASCWLAALALALAACGTLDTSQLEQLVSERIEAVIGFAPASVDCPKDVEAKAGDVFSCTVTGSDGSTAEIEVTQKNDEGNVDVAGNLLKTQQLEQAIKDQLGATEVSCPEIVAVEAGKTVDCDAAAGSDKATIVVTIENDNGDVTFQRR
ncbi:MAG: DUF4333 domain-containing protein [Gaiellales bacterium]